MNTSHMLPAQFEDRKHVRMKVISITADQIYRVLKWEKEGTSRGLQCGLA